MNVENRIKKKKPATTQFHPREMSALLVPCFLSTLHHCDFFSPRHSIPLSLSPPSVLHLSWSHSVHCSGLSLPLSCYLSLYIGALMLSLSLPSERTQVSAVTALVQGIMFVIHSPLLAATQEVHSCTVRLTESVCVCGDHTLSHGYFFFFFLNACLLT